MIRKFIENILYAAQTNSCVFACFFIFALGFALLGVVGFVSAFVRFPIPTIVIISIIAIGRLIFAGIKGK